MPTYRDNREETVFASAARAVVSPAYNSADLSNLGAKGVIVTIDVTAITASPSVVFTLEYKDTLSGKYVVFGTSAAIVGTGTTSLLAYPGATAAANTIFNRGVPAVWRVTATHGDTDSITYSVSANYLL